MADAIETDEEYFRRFAAALAKRWGVGTRKVFWYRPAGENDLTKPEAKAESPKSLRRETEIDLLKTALWLK